MPGRHQLAPARRPALRWLAGVAGAAITTATALAFFPASASADTDPVKATFSVTGVVSNCPVSAGGSDVYVKPGQELDVRSAFAGVTLLNGLLTLNLGDLRGRLVIDPQSGSPVTLNTDTQYKAVPALSTGDHRFTWTVRNVLGLPLKLTSSAVQAGASLTYTGTIHVTSDAARCGVAVQVPGVQVSASVTKLPGVSVSIPGVKATVPVSVPTITGLPGLPGLPGGPSGGRTTAAGGGSSSAGNQLPVPARVVPSGDGDGVYGNVGGGYLPGVLPGSSNLAGGSANNVPVSANGTAKPSAVPALEQDSTGKHKTIDLAASKADSTGQFSVILAIVAIIALSVVAATYARLYLLRRETPTT